MMGSCFEGGYGFMGGFGFFFMILFWGLIIWAIIALVQSVFNNRNQSGSGTPSVPGDTAQEILRKRYAKGEITKVEFDQMKKDLTI